jgi:phosphatidylinositol kinase/protein kinase (PI-3  family)
MISVLRKERRWNLINTYFERFFSQSVLPNVELAQSKILWARGQKDAAIDCLKMTLDIMSLQDPEFLEVGLSKLPLRIFSVLSKHLDNMEIPEEKTELQRMAKEQPILLSRCFRDMLSPVLDGRMESRICRTLGSFMFSRYEHTLDILRLINDMYERAKTSYDKDYKVWLGWAYVNARMIDIVRNDEHAINAVNGFLKATELRPSNTLEFMCQLFSIFFRLKDGSLISQTLTTDLLNLRASVVSQIIPQITVQVAHPNATIRGVVHRILTTFGKEHFQMIFFPLNLYRLSEHREKATFARELLSFLCDLHPDIAADADLFVDGLLRAAISWFEQWILALDAASRAHHEEDMDRMDRILDNLFKSIENPKCDLDRLFVRLHGAAIEQYRRKFEEHTGPAIRSLWDSFKHLFGLLSDRVKKLELILLPKVSEELALKRGFKIAVPGTYSVEKKVPLLDHIEPALQVLGTQQHPRCVFMVSSDGSKLKFLLKGNEDIRLDERVMQFFTLINLLMNQMRTTRELGARIVEYAIIPLSPNAGLITWVTGADTLHQMICEQRQLHNIGQSIEFDMLNEIVGRVFNSMTLCQRLEMFDEITAKCGAKEIRETLWGRAPNAVTWISQSQNFTVTTSLMSMVGYVIGLGDRHPSNIMVQRETGKVIHIDFGDSFESARLRNKFPEKVPFRLTRMIVNALDSGTVEGIFRKTCEDIMWVLRDSKASLVALLEIFVHEPLDELEGQSKRRFQTKIIDQVAQKLMGKDERLSVDESDLDIEGQVDALIREASDPLNYVAHYEGWCPFW